MNGWVGWLPRTDDWFSNLLTLVYAAVCLALLACHGFALPQAWLRSMLPERWIPKSQSDPMYAAWVDLVLSAVGLAVIARVADAPVATLGMLAMAVFGAFVIRATP